MSIDAKAVVEALIESGYKYFGEKPRAWVGDNIQRIYFGSDFVTIEQDGEIHNRRNGKARAATIGDSAVDAVKAAANK